ncbi:hypothetical protein BC833DRAFT_572338 [Globomyces pollinis-pini]|nr:hypothetical protein BC833DRAFT_572338 [Globomyces pollinis-pini]
MPSTSLFSVSVVLYNGRVIPEYLVGTLKDQTSVQTQIFNVTEPFTLNIQNVSIVPSISTLSNGKIGLIGRIVMTVTLNDDCVYAHTINSKTASFHLIHTPGKLNMAGKHSHFTFNADRVDVLRVSLWRVRVLEQVPNGVTIGESESGTIIAHERSLIGTSLRTLNCMRLGDRPILTYSIEHHPTAPLETHFLPYLRPRTVQTEVELVNFIDFTGQENAKKSEELARVNIIETPKFNCSGTVSVGTLPVSCKTFYSKTPRVGKKQPKSKKN